MYKEVKLVLFIIFVIAFTTQEYAHERTFSSQSLGLFAIKDKNFKATIPEDCKTDIAITAFKDGKFTCGGKNAVMSFIRGQSALWCYGAKHTWIGNISYAGYTFDSDKEDPLQFRVDKVEGYVYVKGEGTVTMPDGSIIKLPKEDM